MAEFGEIRQKNIDNIYSTRNELTEGNNAKRFKSPI